MRFVYCLALCATVFVSGLPVSAQVEKADSAYLFAYASPLDEGRSGLKLAWSENGREWSSIGDGFSFLKCDYANWGGEKRMVKPVVYREACGGAWRLAIKRERKGVWPCCIGKSYILGPAVIFYRQAARHVCGCCLDSVSCGYRCHRR